MMGGRSSTRLLFLVCCLALFYLSHPYLYYYADCVRQTNPFSGQKWTEQAFEATESELACLRGQPIPGEAPEGPSDPIPNVVHFIFGLASPLSKSSARRFDFLSYLAVRSALVSLRPDALYLHYTYLADADPLTNNPWLRRLARNITLVHHAPPASSSSSSNHFAHLADRLRLRLLLEQGGIYLDIDAFALRSFDKILAAPRPHDIVLGAEGGNRWGLCNAVMAARANSSFVARWLASYDGADLSREWWVHSPCNRGRLPLPPSGVV